MLKITRAKDQTHQEEMTRAHVFISGLVQGVFFRAYTRQRAASLKLTGWVKNCYDGRVETVFEGPKEAVESMVGWCHKGPPSAVVEKVEVEWQKYKGEFNRFEVGY